MNLTAARSFQLVDHDHSKPVSLAEGQPFHTDARNGSWLVANGFAHQAARSAHPTRG